MIVPDVSFVNYIIYDDYFSIFIDKSLVRKKDRGTTFVQITLTDNSTSELFTKKMMKINIEWYKKFTGVVFEKKKILPPKVEVKEEEPWNPLNYSLKEVSKADKRRAKLQKDGYSRPSSPKVAMSRIDHLGRFSLRFNTPMFVPEDFQSVDYSKIFNIEYRPANGSSSEKRSKSSSESSSSSDDKRRLLLFQKS